MWTLGDKYNVLTPERAAKQLLVKLQKYGPFIYAKSCNRGSYYIHFNDLPNHLTHKLRVSNHNEREKYGYKWQLRLDGFANIHRKQHSRYFADVDSLATYFGRYYDRVERLNRELMAEEEEACQA